MTPPAAGGAADWQPQALDTSQIIVPAPSQNGGENTLPDDLHLHAPTREQLVARSLHPLAHGGEVDIDQFSGPFARYPGDEHSVDVSGVGIGDNSCHRIGQRQRVDVARPDETMSASLPVSACQSCARA